MTASLSDAIEQAKKILGDGAYIVEPRSPEDKLWDEFNKSYQAFDDSGSNLEASLLALQKTITDWQVALKQNAAQYEKEDFGLDPRSKDDVKKIKQVQKMFSDYFASKLSMFATELRTLDDLDKHSIQLDQYKPSVQAK
jgi:hypothetical protein